jgi:multidrug transporter EmrE-like cation transporter
VIWLPLAALFEFGFAQLFKSSQRRGHYAPVVVPANYLMLSSVLTAYLLITGQFAFSPQVLKVGMVTGAVFIFAMTIMTRALQRANVGAVFTAFRIAVVVPVAASVAIWGETVSAAQITGVAFALGALVLMTFRPGETGGGWGLKTLGVIMPVFCCQGVSHTCLRWVHYAGLDGQLTQVLCVIGGTAGILGALWVVLKGYRPRAGETMMGLGIGLYNMTALLVILTTLSKVPGTVFFPVLGCAVVILDNLAAHFYWKEHLSRPAVVGVVLAVCAIILVVN